ncbi:hypothetical protein Tco_1254438 [Tanacetum coccineum]
MEDNQLDEAYLVVVRVVDDENILVDSEIQVMDDVLVDSDAEEKFVAALESNPKYIAKIARIAAVEQAARIDAAEQAINTS